MKPGERVAAIQSLATALANLPRADRDLLLRAFGFTTTDDPSSDPYEYSLHHLEQGGDEPLEALRDHVLADRASNEVPADTEVERLWGRSRLRLFVSHSSHDKVLVGELKGRLAKYGVSAFVAHVDIEPTREWIAEIELALDTCHAIATVLTPHFRESKWTDQEVGYCVKRRVLVLPIRAGLDPYGFIGRYQAVQGGGQSPENLAKALFEVLVQHDLTSVPMAEAIVDRLEDAQSYDSSKTIRQWLDKVPKWTPDLLTRLEGTIDRNSQVRGAFGVPEAIRAIVKQHRS